MLPDSEAAGRVAQAVDALDETIRDIRSAIFTLQSPPVPNAPGLRAQVMTITDEMAHPLGFPPSLRLDGNLDTSVPDSTGQEMLLALREGLSNAARHASASTGEIEVRADRDLVLIVRDDGTGIADTGRRSGLANLDQRARALGGELRLDSPAAGGTSMEWRVPLPAVS